MAANSGAGLGTKILLVVLGIATLALFITSVVFFGRANQAETELANLQTDRNKFITREEEGRGEIQARLEAARAARVSLVAYLDDNLRNTYRQVTGSGTDDLDRLAERLGQTELRGIALAKGADTDGAPPSLRELVDGSNFLSLLRDLDRFILSQRGELEDANRAREIAEADLQNEIGLRTQQRAQHRTTLEALEGEIRRLESDVAATRTDADDFKALLDGRVEEIRADASDRESDLTARISELEGERARLVAQLEQLRALRADDVIRPTDEFALVDATILAVQAASGQATISVGRRDKVILGMTFAVYPEASAIRPDDNGDYPPGKATLEVIEIDNDTATCRILRETPGNPIVRGDVVANAVYDPDKVYLMTLYGNFDADRNGAATDAEREIIRATIERWGGRVTEELAGNVDFLVLGTRPVLPPEPSLGAPQEIVAQFLELQRRQRRYDSLLADARATSIPVLTENRLRTLIGAD